MGIRDLKDRWVLVTGSAVGIGYETALAFARQGANIVLSDINEIALQRARRDVEQLGVRCLSFTVDVSSEAAVGDFAAKVQAEVGAPDVLVNNAGIGYLGPFLHTPLSAWHQSLNVNVMGVVHCCHFFLPLMIAAGGARHLVNVASGAGITPGPNLSAYSASKHAVMGLSDALSMELDSSGVGVTVVCPGIINTDIVRNLANVSPAITQAQIERLQAHYRTVGVHPSVVASIVRGVQRGQDIVLVGPLARSMFHLKRFSRRLMRLATIWDSKKNGYL